MIITDRKPKFDERYEEAKGIFIVTVTGIFIGTALAGFILFGSFKADLLNYVGEYYLESRNCEEVFMESESLTEYRGQYMAYKCEIRR